MHRRRLESWLRVTSIHAHNCAPSSRLNADTKCKR